MLRKVLCLIFLIKFHCSFGEISGYLWQKLNKYEDINNVEGEKMNKTFFSVKTIVCDVE